jgi:hypothetical protein
MIRAVEKMPMDEKITIIEGPPPTFEAAHEGWVLGLNDSPSFASFVLTRLRTYNGSALIERCYRAWNNKNAIQLEYRDVDGLQKQAPIVAARTLEADEGQMLLLWVRLDIDEAELETDLDDDLGDEADDDFGFPDP